MIGRSIAHYEIESRLGQGGMGDVYLARDTRLGRNVAIKFLGPKAGQDPSSASRLLREARAASSLNHPNIVTVYEIGEAEGFHFIAMEYVPGKTLSHSIHESGLPVARVIDISIQIASALAAAHRAHIAHRDLKPGNVIVTPSGQAKVLDFGLAKAITPEDVSDLAATRRMETVELSTPGLIMGTLGYMSPEQIQGKSIDARSDLFSMGVLMFEMLTGRRPFEGDSKWDVMSATIAGNAPSVSKQRPETPPALARIVQRCLSPDPQSRYASGDELLQDLEKLASPEGALQQARRSRSIALAGVGLAMMAAIVVGLMITRESHQRWATGTAMIEVDSLRAHDDRVGAYQVARRAIEIAPRDSRVKQAWADLTEVVTLESNPTGALVSLQSYTRPNQDWMPLGRTPIHDVRVPFGFFRWRLTKAGYDTLEVGQGANAMEFRLVRSDSSQTGMALIPPGSFAPEFTHGEVALPEFWLDKYEVTNRQYKAFLDAGGYRDSKYWTEPLIRGMQHLSFEQAMSLFRDTTGQPGPATWELGTYPEGQGDYPVGGVSWFEAAAYASFVGKQLPTAYHWYRASGAFGVFSEITTASNFSAKGSVRVGSMGGLGIFGTYDMAGNVKEWCWNADTEGKRYLLGGGWSEADYMFHDQDAQSPFERHAMFGFRCMKQFQPVPPQLTASIPSLERDMSALKPVDPGVYQIYRRLYDYDATPLEARIEQTDDSNPLWRLERVSIQAAYGDDRFPICLFLPRSIKPPYQTVVFFPSSTAIFTASSQNLGLEFADFFPRSGRVLVYPIYQGTFERRRPPHGQNELRDVMIQRGKDLRRTLDYLATRADIDTTRIAFYGLSLGAQLGPWCLAIEPRLRFGVFFSGGFETWDMPPECDPVNFAPHVTVPVLMVNGREDFDLPYKTAQLPLYNSLGTPYGDKRHVVFEGGHIPPHPQEAIKTILEWMDARMGRVN